MCCVKKEMSVCVGCEGWGSCPGSPVLRVSVVASAGPIPDTTYGSSVGALCAHKAVRGGFYPYGRLVISIASIGIVS